MTLSIQNKFFRYGQHEIPLGNPYSFLVDPEDHTVTLHSYGGMGLESSKIHEVTFCFPAETAEKAKQIVGQLLTHAVHLNEGTGHSDSAAFMGAFGNNNISQAYQITQGKVLRASGFSKYMKRIDANTTQVGESYEFGEDLCAAVPASEMEAFHKQLDAVESRLRIIYKKYPDFVGFFSDFTEQISLVRSREKLTQFDVEILVNSLEISDLKYFIKRKEWIAFKNYIWLDSDEGFFVLLSFRSKQGMKNPSPDRSLDEKSSN